MSMFAFFRFASALRVIYEVDFEPRDESFLECSPEQYRELTAQGFDGRRRWFILTRGVFERANNPPSELRVVDEEERELLLGAARWIVEKTNASGGTFTSFQERLELLKDRLPEVLWRPSQKPQARPHLRLVRDEAER
jgi:hypothetical protein